jgi:hypothetical protein
MLELFTCDRLRAELTRKGCVANQEIAKARPGSIQGHACHDCDLGRVLAARSNWAGEEPRAKYAERTGKMKKLPTTRTGKMKKLPTTKELGGIDPDFTWGLTTEERIMEIRGDDHSSPMCKKHPARPGHKGSSFCLECLQARMQVNNKAGKQTSAEAFQVWRRFKAGEVVDRLTALEGIFGLVEGLQRQIEAAALENIRTIEAEIAIRLRESFK